MRFLLEVLIAFAFSALVAMCGIGIKTYIEIGIVIAAIAAAAIYATNGLVHNRDNAPTPTWIALTLVLSMLLGAMWPAVPLIFLYERKKRIVPFKPTTPPDDVQ